MVNFYTVVSGFCLTLLVSTDLAPIYTILVSGMTEIRHLYTPNFYLTLLRGDFTIFYKDAVCRCVYAIISPLKML